MSELAGVVFEGYVAVQYIIRETLAARSSTILPMLDDLSDCRQMPIKCFMCIDTNATGSNAALLALKGG